MYTHDVIIPKSMHENSIDPLHLVPLCPSVIFATLKESTQLFHRFSLGFKVTLRNLNKTGTKQYTVRRKVKAGYIIPLIGAMYALGRRL